MTSSDCYRAAYGITNTDTLTPHSLTLRDEATRDCHSILSLIRMCQFWYIGINWLKHNCLRSAHRVEEGERSDWKAAG